MNVGVIPVFRFSSEKKTASLLVEHSYVGTLVRRRGWGGAIPNFFIEQGTEFPPLSSVASEKDSSTGVWFGSASRATCVEVVYETRSAQRLRRDLRSD